MNGREDIWWAPRVNLHKVKALYLSSTNGIYDDELIDDVGIALYLRCESILEYTWAVEGKVKCKRCDKNGTEAFIIRQKNGFRELLCCSICGWQIQWKVYLSETKKRASGQLLAGHARPAFEEYCDKYPKCKETGEKMIVIDQLIHQFHWLMRGTMKSPVADRTACVNLLEGTATQIMELLNSLTYGENAEPELLKTRLMWSSQKLNTKRKD